MRYSKKFADQLKKLIKGGHPELKRKMKEIQKEICSEPHRKRPSLDIKLITSRKEGVYRIRLGELRIIYEIDEKEKIVWVTGIFHRGRGYKRK